MIPLENDNYCIACGKDNPIGLRLRFEETETGARASFTPRREHQGYKNIVHGGIISMVLDEAMSWAAIKKGMWPVTAEMEVRFKAPLHEGQKVLAEGWIEKKKGRLIIAGASLTLQSEGTLVATARGRLFIDEPAG